MQTPSLLTWLRATARGEVSAETLEALRRASMPVLELLEAVESTRRGAGSVWSLSPQDQLRIVCAWNAFVLQRLGSALLEADYLDNPATTGFLPPATGEQAMAFFTPIEGWMESARHLASDPHAQFMGDLPAPLPPWIEQETSPPAYVRGLLDAMKAICDHTCTAVEYLGSTAPSDPRQAMQFGTIQGLFASARTKARYAEDIYGSHPKEELFALVRRKIQVAIERLHHVAQLAAMPEIAGVCSLPQRVGGTPAEILAEENRARKRERRKARRK